MLKIIIGLLSVSLFFLLFNVYTRWQKSHDINFEYIISSMLIVACIFYFNNLLIKNDEAKRNLNAVYDHFGEDQVEMISINKNGAITNALVDNVDYKIKVNRGDVNILKIENE